MYMKVALAYLLALTAVVTGLEKTALVSHKLTVAHHTLGGPAAGEQSGCFQNLESLLKYLA